MNWIFHTEIYVASTWNKCCDKNIWFALEYMY